VAFFAASAAAGHHLSDVVSDLGIAVVVQQLEGKWRQGQKREKHTIVPSRGSSGNLQVLQLRQSFAPPGVI
jgi:hypothetical protein